MEKLDDGGQADMGIALKSKCLAAQKDQHRAEALTTTLHDVLTNLFNHGDVRGELIWN